MVSTAPCFSSPWPLLLPFSSNTFPLLSCRRRPSRSPRSAHHPACPFRIQMTSLDPAFLSPTPIPPTIPSPLSFIGGSGSLATSIITGLLSTATSPTILASGPSLTSLSRLPLSPTSLTTSNLTAARRAELVFLCVKPDIAPTVLREIAPAFERSPPPALVSVVAGLPTSHIRAVLPPATPVIRAMPNLPARHRAALTAVCAAPDTPDDYLQAAAAVFRCVGDVEIVPERLFPAFSAVSGAGVAYLFMAAEALADAAVRHNLPRDMAMRVAAATIKGAGENLMEGEHPAVLRNRVESPGGVTIAATAELERAGFRAALLDAVDTAVERVIEMEEEAESEE